MLLRRSVASLRGLALQSEPWRLALRASASTGPTERRPEPGDADALLAYWRGLLDDDRQRHAGGGAAGQSNLWEHPAAFPTLQTQHASAPLPADVLPLSDEDVRQLLQTVLLVRGDRVQSALPEQLTALFARYYRQLGDRQDRVALLASVAASFGVQVGGACLACCRCASKHCCSARKVRQAGQP